MSIEREDDVAKDDYDEDWGKPDETGGIPNRVTLTVGKARYTIDDSYDPNSCLLKFVEMDIEEIDNPQEDWSPFWPMGKGWEPAEGGKRATHETRSTPHVTSALGQVFRTIFGTKAEKGMEYEGEPLGRVLREHSGVSNPLDAELWAGTRWTFERQAIPESEEFAKQRAEKGKPPRSTLIPVEFLGFAGEKGKKAAGKKASAWDAEAFLAEVDAPVRKELRKAARKSDSADEFGDLAGEIEALGEDDELKAAVLGHLEEIRAALVE